VTSTDELQGLREGQVLDKVPLTVTQASALNASALVKVEPSGPAWRVTAAHAVGAVRVGDLVVRVQPKIGALQVLRLLSRAHGLKHLVLDEETVGLGIDPDLHALLALLFAAEARQALAAGAVRGYREEQQALPVLRGRLRMRDQELRRFGLLMPLEVTFDDWSADTDDNRRIRAAVRHLLWLPAVPDAVRLQLGWVDRLLGDVTVPPSGAQLPPWAATRLNQRLHALLRLSDIVLSESTFESRAGLHEASGFVLRMEKLFEDLVTRLLGELDDDTRVHPQATYRLDTKKRLTIKPDLVFVRAGHVVGVADTKYKILDDRGRLRNDDGYQLVTYCRRLGLRAGHLIYAAGQLPTEPFDIPQADVVLHVHKIDISRPVEQLEEDVKRLRARILLHRDDNTIRSARAPESANS
jgi:5-methylcytosine-specific restriction enzyme subunit McrC